LVVLLYGIFVVARAINASMTPCSASGFNWSYGILRAVIVSDFNYSTRISF
jgi:hypothetical protein